MSYSRRPKYKNRREKNRQAAKNMKYIVITVVLFVLILAAFNWVEIKDHLKTYFY